MITSTTALSANGQDRQITTTVDLTDLRVNGVAWCETVRSLAARGCDQIERLGALMNIARVCEANAMYTEAAGALRFARRLVARSIPIVDEMIDATRKNARFRASVACRDYEVLAFDDESSAFMALLDSEVICENVYHPGAPYGGLIGVGGIRPIPPDPSVDNASFHVCRRGVRMATVPLAIHEDNVANWVQWVQGMGGVPAQVYFSEACDNRRKVLQVIVEYLDYLMRAYAVKEVVLQEPQRDDMALYMALGTQVDFSAEIWDRAVIDLRQAEDRIFAAVRKSYKSNINWCMENLSMEYVSGEAVDDAFTAYVHESLQRLHAKIVQKFGDGMTPNLFRLPLVMCAMKMGEVAIARTPSGNVCALSVTTDAGGIAYYALAGSIPLENKNPGHFIVYDSMLRARARGAEVYHASRLFGAPVTIAGLNVKVKTRHELASAFFKRGFSESLDIQYVYRILPRNLTIFGNR